VDVGRIDLGFHAGASAEQVIEIERPLLPLYVRVGGDDEAAGTAPESALATLGAAARLAAAGITVVVGPGTYAENNISPRRNSGVVTFFADADGVATLDAPGIVLIDAGLDAPAFFLGNACESVVDGFHVRGGESGIQVRDGSDRAWVTNNVIFSARTRGVDVWASRDVRVTNNLVYANGGGVQVLDAPLALVANNTIHGNTFNGIFVHGASSLCTRIRYNIIEDNLARGLLVRLLPQIVEWNINTDEYLGIARPDSDRNDSALLADPAGSDGVLGGTGFADDVFQLRADSSAIDLVDLAVGDTELAQRSATADGIPDRGRLDAGFHYPAELRDPATRSAATALADEQDFELCDELLAEPQPTPGTEPRGGGSGGCSVAPRPAVGLFVPSSLILLGYLVLGRDRSRRASTSRAW